MASARDVDRSDAPLSGDAVARREFAQARRGYDQDEVRQFLEVVGREIDAVGGRANDLERRMAESETKATAPDLSEEAVVAAVGAEMAATLRSAHTAATELRKRAADETEQLVAETRQRVDGERAESERQLRETTAEAERLLAEAVEAAAQERSEAAAEAEERLRLATAEADKRRADAEQDAARVAAEAAAEAERLVTETAAEAEAAAAAVKRDATSEAQQIIGKVRADAELVRQQSERERAEMIETAQAERDRVIADLVRRRRVATIQIEQLRAGRERLIDSYAMVRRTLEEVQDDLNRADAEARAAADAVGQRLEADPGAGSEVADLDPVFAPVPTPVDDASTAPSGQPVGASAAGDPSVGASALASSVVGRVTPTPAAGAAVAAGADRVRFVPVGSDRSRGGSVAAATSLAPSAPSSPSEAPPPAAGGHLRVVSSVVADPALDQVESPADTHPVVGVELELVRDTPDGPDGGADDVAQAIPAEEAIAEREAVSADGGSADPAPTDAVGSLFDRIRDGRQQAVDNARQVLDEAPEPAAEPTVAEVAPSEPVVVASETVPAPEPGPARHHEDPDAGVAHSDADELRLQQRETALADLERDLNRRIKRTLQDEQNDLLDRLRSVKGAPRLDDLLVPIEAHLEPYRSAAQPILTHAAVAGFDLGREWQGEPPDSEGRGPDTRTAAEQARLVAERIVDPLRRQIEKMFADQGEDGPERLTEGLGSVYRSTRAQRVERIAADVISSTFAAGTWQATPAGATLRWIAEDADGPCPDCDDNALAGSLVKGETFPTGQLHPPAHDGCRCLLVPESQ